MATVDTSPKSSAAAEPEAGPRVEVLKSAMEKHCFITNTSFNHLEDDCERDPGSVLTEKVNLDLSDLLYNTRSAQRYSRSAYEVLSKRDMENLVKVVGSFMAPGTHWYVFCLDLLFYLWNKSVRAAKV